MILQIKGVEIGDRLRNMTIGRVQVAKRYRLVLLLVLRLIVLLVVILRKSHGAMNSPREKTEEGRKEGREKERRWRSSR